MKVQVALGVALCAIALLAGCSRHRHGANSDPDNPPPPLTALPPVPQWAAPLMGTDTRHGFSKNNDCQGAFDVVSNVHTSAPKGAQANGWAWLTVAKTAPTHIIFTDFQGRIVGAGDVDSDRPDVPEARPDITTKRVGWHGVLTDGSGTVTALVLQPGKQICDIGSKEL